MMTDKQIADAKVGFKYSYNIEVFHEHNDCIRLAYEWLDAQNVRKHISQQPRSLKQFVEKWAGRYVSDADVQIAASLNLRIRRRRGDFNVASRLILPSDQRLTHIGEAFAQIPAADRDLRGYDFAEE